MNTIPGDKRPPIQGRRIINLKDETVAAALSVTLLGDSIRLTLLPFNEFSLDSIEVFFGAAEFPEATSQFRRDHAIPSASRDFAIAAS
jgi:hypothetical protein